MDFRQTTQPNNSRPAGVGVSAVNPAGREASRKGGPRGGKWLNVMNIVVLFGIAILVAAIALAFTRGGDNESKYISNKHYQAVFLNNGQVYFGNINNLNGKYLRMTNIYYLTQSSSADTSGKAATNGNYSLVKLGCQQIHDPFDEMIINRDQVTFWENLQDSGKVVTSIKQFIKQNPKGPDCSQVSNQTQASGSANAQGGTTTPTQTTTPTTPPTTGNGTGPSTKQ